MLGMEVLVSIPQLGLEKVKWGDELGEKFDIFPKMMGELLKASGFMMRFEQALLDMRYVESSQTKLIFAGAMHDEDEDEVLISSIHVTLEGAVITADFGGDTLSSQNDFEADKWERELEVYIEDRYRHGVPTR